MNKLIINECVKCQIKKNIKKHPILNILLCENCILRLEYNMITIKEAKEKYNITKRYLKKLENNKNECEKNLLYLELDVKKIQMERNDNVYVSYKKILFSRVEQLRKYNVPFQDEIHPKLWRYVIGNYLDNSVIIPNIDIKTILERGLASVRITNENIPKSIYLVYYFMKDKTSDGNEIVKNALKYSKIKINTFNIVESQISTYLTRDDKRNWISSYIEADYSKYLNKLLKEGNLI